MKQNVFSVFGVLFVLGGAALWLLFPACAFLALTIIGIGACILFYRYVFVRWVRMAGTVFLIIGCMLFAAAEVPVLCGMRGSDNTEADYLVVAGAGVNGTEPSLPMLERLYAAYDWLEANPEGIAIVSGSRGDCSEDISEAQAMATWLQEQGISPERIIMDEDAGSTWENIFYALRIIEQRGGDSSGPIAFASSDYHMYRIGAMARRQGCEPALVSAKSTLPALGINYSIREAFAVWRLWILGY